MLFQVVLNYFCSDTASFLSASMTAHAISYYEKTPQLLINKVIILVGCSDNPCIRKTYKMTLPKQLIDKPSKTKDIENVTQKVSVAYYLF